MQSLEDSALLNKEIKALESQYAERVKNKEALKAVLQEYDNTVVHFIGE